MSYWSDIYAGDARKIAEAISAGESLEGQSFVHAHVNLPGIVPGGEEFPNSPVLLTELAASAVSVRVSFSGSITEYLAGDPDPVEASDGVYRMATTWMELFAELTDQQIDALTKAWCREWAPGADQGSIGRIEMMITDLRRVCRTARQRGSALVYRWTM